MNRKAFTLVELLAVIVILSIILVIGIPKIINVIEDSKEESLKDSVMIIASQAEKKYVERVALENLDQTNDPIVCSDVTKLSVEDYDSCVIKIQNSKVYVDIVGKGKYKNKYICNATKSYVTISDEDCSTYATSVITNSEEMLNDDTGDSNLRYSGANPNNYVTFNGEVWRIIGIFNVSNGTTTQQRVKIIRNTSIGSYSWDSSASDINYGYGTNDWVSGDLNLELNTIYYNRTSGTCYNGQNDANTTCDFSTVGLNVTAKNMIENTVWNIGGAVYSNPTASPYGLPTLDTYNKERGTTVYSGRPTTWTGIVGLSYPSDFGYASTDAECRKNLRAGVTSLNYTWDYTNVKCKNNNWFPRNYNWTLTPYSSMRSNVFITVSGGIIDYSGASSAFGILPVVYLKYNVKITGGTGTSADPYILSL